MKDLAQNNQLLTQIVGLIETTKQKVALSINSELVLLNWNIGNSIKNDILQNKRADYGKEVIKKLSKDLTQLYGKGFTETNLRYFLKFAEVFPDEKIPHTLCEKFSWSHIRMLMYIENDLKRMFYVEMCKIERWSVRTLQERIDSMLFERTAISKKPELTIKNDLEKLANEGKMSPDLVFRDPYFLDFAGLHDSYSEKDLENSIIRELEKFILEFGSDFAFLARQKRMTIDNEDFYLDLLFFHRRLKCLVAIELKLGKFQAAHKGQMELYLRWLEKYEKHEDENLPIGLILCAEKSQEQVELLFADQNQIRVAEYLNYLPSKELLQQKLHKAVELAQYQFKDLE